MCLGGAQHQFGIPPDLTCLGKIIGGGMPVGAFGGRADVMSYLAPLGPVYQAGTLSGNPIAMTAGSTTLQILEKDIGFYERLEAKTQQLGRGIMDIAKTKAPILIQQQIGLMGLFFTEKDCIECFEDVQSASLEDYQKLFHGLLKEGVYIAPSMYEVSFLSDAHDGDVLDKTLQAFDTVFSHW